MCASALSKKNTHNPRQTKLDLVTYEESKQARLRSFSNGHGTALFCRSGNDAILNQPHLSMFIFPHLKMGKMSKSKLPCYPVLVSL